jgi:hypothetical protein
MSNASECFGYYPPARRSSPVIGALGDPNRRSGSWPVKLSRRSLGASRCRRGGPRHCQFSRLGGLFSTEVLLINSLLVVQLLGEGEHSLFVELAREVGERSCSAKPITHIHRSIARLWCWRSSHCREASARPVTPPSCLPAARSNRLLLGWNPPPLVTRAAGTHCDIRVRRYGFCRDSQ